MSGTSSVTNTFQSQTGDIPLSQLDENYTDLTDYLNDPTNRNNFAVASGASTYAITLSPPATGGYTSGLEVTWQAASANTAAVALNVNGLGAVPLLYADSAAVSAIGALSVGGVYKAVYNGSAFIFQGIGNSLAATQAQQQTATATGVYISPNSQQWHPSASKAWAYWSGTATGTITALASYNIASISRGGTGTYTILFLSPMTSTAWAMSVTAQDANPRVQMSARSTTASSCVVISYEIVVGAPADAAFASFIAFGTRA